MAQKIVIALGDELPTVSALLTDVDGAIDLTGSTVVFEMYSGSTTISVTCEVQSPASAGHVHFDPSAAMVATRGLFPGRYKITTSAAKDLHVPNDEHVSVYIT